MGCTVMMGTVLHIERRLVIVGPCCGHEVKEVSVPILGARIIVYFHIETLIARHC
jgi:hypothetical protein